MDIAIKLKAHMLRLGIRASQLHVGAQPNPYPVCSRVIYNILGGKITPKSKYLMEEYFKWEQSSSKCNFDQHKQLAYFILRRELKQDLKARGLSANKIRLGKINNPYPVSKDSLYNLYVGIPVGCDVRYRINNFLGAY